MLGEESISESLKPGQILNEGELLWCSQSNVHGLFKLVLFEHKKHLSSPNIIIHPFKMSNMSQTSGLHK